MIDTAPTTWYATLLGAVRIEGPSGTVERLRTRKAFALLVFLLLNRSRAHSREELAERFWPEDTPESSRSKLRLALHSIRGSLGDILTSDRFSVSVAGSERIWSDRDEFLRLLSSRSGDKDERLARAVELYRGPFLPGFYEDWVLAERERLESAAAFAWREIAEGHVTGGRWSAALAAADRLVALEPYDETAHILALRSLRELGRHEAIARYLDWTRDRFAEFGSRPGPEIEAFALPPQTVGEDEREPSFLGREAELGAVIEAVRRSGIVTLWGPPGIGKTRLAREAIRALSGEGRTVFVSAVGIRTPESLEEILLHVLATKTDGVQDIGELAEAAPETVVAVDNCEELTEDAATLFARIRTHNPALRFLLTSQRRLGLPGEVVLPVRSLDIPSEDATLAQVAACSSMRLLRERVRERGRRLKVDESNYAAYRSLCRRLEGLPLALELAAEWLDVLGPTEVVARLDESGKRLSSRFPGRNPRHLSLESAIAASLAQLDERLSEAMSALAVFVEGWDIEAATAVLPVRDMAGILSELEARALIKTELVAGRIRYSMLESIRLFVQDTTSEADQREYPRRHAEYFARLSGAMARDPQSLAATHRADDENVRLAVETLIENEPDPDRVAQVVGDLIGFWQRLGRWALAERAIRGALARLPDAPSRRKANLYFCLGLIGGATENQPLCEWGHARSCVAYEAIGDSRAAARGGGNLALALMTRGDFDGAVPLLRRQVESARTSGGGNPSYDLLYGTHNLGDLLLKVGEEEEGTALLQESIRIAVALDAIGLMGLSFGTLGWHLVSTGKLAQAEPYLRRAVELGHRADERDPCISAHAQLAVVLAELDNPMEASEHLRLIVDSLLDVNRAYAFAEAAEAGAYIANRTANAPIAARLMGAVRTWRRRAAVASPAHITRLARLEETLATLLGADRFTQEALRGETLSRSELVATLLTALAVTKSP